MRENRPYGSEGGVGESRSLPLSTRRGRISPTVHAAVQNTFDAGELHHGPESADQRRRLSRPTLRTPMHRKPFETDIANDGAHLIGPWRSPRQMLAEQVYDDHVSIHDDATAKRLGFQGGAIEGSTHFSQFAPLGERLWGEAWFETGCLSAHYRNPAFEGEDVQAVVAKPPAGARETEIRMVKRDGAEVLRGTASVAGAEGPTALERRLAEGLPAAA